MSVLTYKQILTMSAKLKDQNALLAEQNAELEAQKKELSIQSRELTRQNTELEIQKNQLNEANRLKTVFLSNMSHELRTPLNSVIALSGVLNRKLEGKIPEDEYSYIEVIERNGKQLLNLINDILDISRIEAGREEIEITSFNLTDVVSDVVRLIKPQADLKNIKLNQKNKEEKITIATDVAKLRHILQNLVGNAVKFTEKGSVEVKVEINPEGAIVEVKDTGIGIEEASLSYVFDEFRQGDSSTSRRYGGSGLGLAIAKKYSNLLGGKISVESKPGKGSRFTLFIPWSISGTTEVLHDSLQEKSFSDVGKKPRISSKGDFSKTILLIEDSEPAIIQITYALEENGYNLIVAKDGFEAIEILKTKKPDGIILD